MKNKFIIGGVVFVSLIGLSLYLNSQKETVEKKQTITTNQVTTTRPTKTQSSEQKNTELSSSSSYFVSDMTTESTTIENEQKTDGSKNHELATKFIHGFYEYKSIDDKNEILKNLLSPAVFKRFEIATDSQAISIQPKILGIDLYDQSADKQEAVALVDLSFEGVSQKILIVFNFFDDPDLNKTIISDLQFLAIKTQ